MGMFDVIVIDRTLHMLDAVDRAAVLARLLGHVSGGGWVLIADEAPNIPAFKDVLNRDAADWRIDFAKRGYLFVQRA